MSDPAQLSPSTCAPLPLFVRLAGAGLACLSAVLMVATAHWLLKPVGLPNLAAYLTLGVVLALGYTAIEALCSSGWRRMALAAGLSVGPTTVFALWYGTERLHGASSFEAMLHAGQALTTPQGWWHATLCSLLLAGSLGALLWGQRQGGHPVANAAGVGLVAATLFLAVDPVGLPSPSPYFPRFLASRVLWLVALPCALPQLFPPCQRVARAAWERAATPASRPPLGVLLGRGARGALGWIRCALTTRADPCAGPEQRLREALHVCAPLLTLLGGWLLLGALLEPAFVALSRGAARYELWAPALSSDGVGLNLVRAGALLAIGSGLLLWRIQVGSLPRPRTAVAVALWAIGLTLNLLVVFCRSDSSTTGQVFVVAVGTLGVAGGIGLASWRPLLGVIGANLSLAVGALQARVDLNLWVPEWIYLGGQPLQHVIMAACLALVLTAAWRWGIQPCIVGGAAAGSTLLGSALMNHVLPWGWSSEGAGWGWPDDVLLDGLGWGLVGGLAGGLAGRLLDRATPRYARPISLALVGAALALSWGWSRSIQPPRDRQLLRLQARAEAGDPLAMLRLGEGMLVRGQADRPEDLQAAALWQRRAAEAQLPRAMHRWGCRQLVGRGTPRRRAEGRAWVERAAAAGWTGAAERLAWEDERAREEDELRR